MALIAVIFVFPTMLIIGNTFAAEEYTVVFNRAEGNEVLKTCKTDKNGLLDEDCIIYIKGICGYWSTSNMYGGQGSNNSYSCNQFSTKVFTEDMNYYCVSGTSVQNWSRYVGCYVCKTDNTIMHWSTNDSPNSKCPSGYRFDYYISQDDCKTNEPDACYVCKNNEDMVKWDNNGDADSDCSSGYSKDASITTESDCRPAPNACYVCNSDSNVMKWDNTDKADSKCSSGYTEDKTITQNQCTTITNPQTGNMLLYILGFVGILSLAYSIYCYKFKFLKNSN